MRKKYVTKISVSIPIDLLTQIDEAIKEGVSRNRSAFITEASGEKINNLAKFRVKALKQQRVELDLKIERAEQLDSKQRYEEALNALSEAIENVRYASFDKCFSDLEPLLKGFDLTDEQKKALHEAGLQIWKEKWGDPNE